MPISPRAYFAMTILLASVSFAAACSRSDEKLNKYEIPEDGRIKGEVTASDADTFSIAIEATVSNAPDARQGAWNYFSTPLASSPLKARVEIRSEAGSLLFADEVVDPKLSSWTAKQLYLEIGRVELVPGKYRIDASLSGKSLRQHPDFKANIVVIPAYQGK